MDSYSTWMEEDERKNKEKEIKLKYPRLRYSKNSIQTYLELITPPELKDKYISLYLEYKDTLETFPASGKHHHYWAGGYSQHVREVMGISLDIYGLYKGDLSKITESDIIIACFLHDFAKVWGYKRIPIEDKDNPKYHPLQQFVSIVDNFRLVDAESKTLLELSRHGITPTEMQWGAVLFAEGGFSDASFGYGGLTYTGNKWVNSNPLAVIVHMADLYSAGVLGGSFE